MRTFSISLLTSLFFLAIQAYDVVVVYDQADVYNYYDNDDGSSSGHVSGTDSSSGSTSSSSSDYDDASGSSSGSSSSQNDDGGLTIKNETDSSGNGSGDDFSSGSSGGSQHDDGGFTITNETDINDDGSGSGSGSGEIIIIVPEEQTDATDAVYDLETGSPEQSTEAPRKGTTYDFDNMPTGKPEASTVPNVPLDNEPAPSYVVPIADPTANPIQLVTDAGDDTLSTSNFADAGSGVLPDIEQITTSDNTTSSSYTSQLSRWMQDLNMRRNQTATSQVCNTYYQSRVADQLATSNSAQLTAALQNITTTQLYITGLMTSASSGVQTAYSDICNITSKAEFFGLPKKTRYLRVNNIIENLSQTEQSELNDINTKAKAYCKSANVDTPPYTIGNIVGLKLANGAILSK